MIIPVIQFQGNCEEALHYYESVFDATIIHIEYKREENRTEVLHSDITICGTRFNMSDLSEKLETGNRFKFNVFLESEDAVEKVYTRLLQNGKSKVELGPQFWTSLFGCVVDQYGVEWRLMPKEAM